MRQLYSKSWFIGAIATGLMSTLATSVQAQDIFDNRAVQFPEDTIVEFEFLQSHGSYQAAFGVRNETTGEETILFQEVKPYDAFGTNQPIQTSRVKTIWERKRILSEQLRGERYRINSTSLCLKPITAMFSFLNP